MQMKIRRAAVLGAGVMGAQIAALLATAGVRTYLLDLTSKEPPADPKAAKAMGKYFRSSRALMAIENLKNLKPSPLYTASALAGIIPGNFDDDMSVLADCDWVIEVVIEKLDIKKAIHKRIAEVVRPHVPVTTNTSGISLADICAGLPEHYQANFFGTHFFNPPRYMRLLEIIPHDGVNQEVVSALTNWISENLGKGIVVAADTVNFIANRIGVFANQVTLKHMADLNLNIETIDALTGKLMGRPSSASFRTMDVVGLDTFVHVANNTYDRAPKDPYREVFKSPAWVMELIENKALGQKTNDVGCFKKTTDDKGRRLILAYRPETKSYEPQSPVDYPWMADALKEPNLIKRLGLVMDQKDSGGELVWRILRDVFSYASLLVHEIAGDQVKPVDEAIKWGFNWDMGPFELWQALGYDAVLKRMELEKVPLPAWAKSGLAFYRPAPGSAEWASKGPSEQLQPSKARYLPVKQASYQFHLPRAQSEGDKRTILSNKSASLVDIGDGVSCLVFHSKMNALDSQMIELMQKAIVATSQNFDAMVIANDAEHFSAGANLKQILELINKKEFDTVERFIRDFQGTMQLLKFASFPSVACPHGLTLGGGCEVALHASWRVASGETYAGLVEIGVGLLPAGGGTKELALRAYDFMNYAEKGDPLAFLQKAFFLIGMAKTSSSGHEAVEMGLLPQTTRVCLSRDHQILRAKHGALHLARQGYIPATPRTAVPVLGDPGINTFRMALYNMVEGRQISHYDAFVGEKIATVLCGGEVDGGQLVSEQYLLDLERRMFVDLCKEAKTVERIEYMLKNGKPLRN